MTQTKVEAPFVANNAHFKNLFINGDMQIAQRGTSFSLTNGNSQFPVDRFKVFTEGSFAYTVSQSTDVPTGEGFTTSLKVDVTTAAGSPSAGDQTELQTNLEGQMLQHLKKGTSNAEKVTVSFYVKCTATGNLQLNLRDLDNARMIGSTFTINSSDTWEKKEIVFAGDTSGAFDNDNAGSLRVSIMLGSGSTYTGGAVPTAWEAYSNGDKNAGDTLNFSNSTSNDFLITGFQLEVGDQATDFEHLPHDVQLQRCYRYCQRHPSQDPTGGAYAVIASGHNSGTTAQLPIVHHYIPMRGDPSLTNSGNFRVHHANTNTATSSATTLDDNTSSPSISLLVVTVSSGLTVGQSALYEQNNDSDAHIILDAEF